MKAFIKLLTIFLVMSFGMLYSQSGPNRFTTSISFLTHNAPLLEMAYFSSEKKTYYAMQYKPWTTRYNIAHGFSIAGAYDRTFKNGSIIRVQTGIETTGWISAFLDVGGGILKKLGNNTLRFEFYLSTLHTGGKLKLLTDENDTINVYTFMIGAKTRVAFDIPIGAKRSLSPFISYATYPYNKSSKDVIYNGTFGRYIYDSFNIGLEFASYF